MKNRKREAEPLPLALGTGLVALDVVVEIDVDSHPRLRTGGTCGNVLLALRYLGFDATPVCRLQDDPAGRSILDEFRAWGIRTKYVTLSEDGSSPIIVQVIRPTPGGVPTHRFSWRCPHCGARFPGYKPVLASSAEVVAAEMSPPQVFFFDRVNRGALLLATRASELGALVVFEPSSVGDPVLFREAWAVAHVVKYSHERLAELPDGLDFGPPLILQVETHGEDGLRYRARFGKRTASPWKSLDAFRIPVIRDSAGAGDWCTAGVLHQLAQEGVDGFREASPAKIEDGLRFGQALATWSCRYLGARGGMSQTTVVECLSQVAQILAGRKTGAAPEARVHLPPIGDGFWCPGCSEVQAKSEAFGRRVKRSTA